MSEKIKQLKIKLADGYSKGIPFGGDESGGIEYSVATQSANGLMSAEDKQHLNAVYEDYSSALTALGATEL